MRIDRQFPSGLLHRKLWEVFGTVAGEAANKQIAKGLLYRGSKRTSEAITRGSADRIGLS